MTTPGEFTSAISNAVAKSVAFQSAMTDAAKVKEQEQEQQATTPPAGGEATASVTLPAQS